MNNMFTSIIFLCALCPFVGFLWARTTSLWMSNSTKRAVWRFPPWTGPRATAPLSRRSKAWPALAAPADIKRRTASPTPPSAAAAPAACRSSAPSRSDVWRGRLCPTGTSCVSACRELRPLDLLGKRDKGGVASPGRQWGWRAQYSSKNGYCASSA